MPISSFYGLQTSLRGLLAQQRTLDITGHNIANASTAGYSRQEAVLAASPALQRPGRRAATGAGAHLGSGVDVAELPPRPRPVPRPPVPRPEHEPRRLDGARRRRSTAPSSRSPSPATTASTRSSPKFWDAWSDLANAPGATRPPSRRWSSRRSALADSFARRAHADGRRRSAGAPSTAIVRRDRRRPAARSRRSPPRSPSSTRRSRAS